jgi:hypothetical protein
MTGQSVGQDSVLLRLPNEIAVGVAQPNHKMVCKFGRWDSGKYDACAASPRLPQMISMERKYTRQHGLSRKAFGVTWSGLHNASTAHPMAGACAVLPEQLALIGIQGGRNRLEA